MPDLTSTDPLNFSFRGTTYKDRIKADTEKSGVTEAIKIGKAFIKGRGVVVAAMDPDFLMGSMGAVVGEKFCAAAEMAMAESLPFIAVSCSGGARMHEGVVSLGQMAKTSAAVAKLDRRAACLFPFWPTRQPAALRQVLRCWAILSSPNRGH